MKYEFSIIVPAYNEVQNILPLYTAIKKIMTQQKYSYELIICDDGSTDGTVQKLKELEKKDKNVKPIFFYKNFGQTAAMDACIKASTGKYIVALDADLQNDPRDIPRLHRKIKEGFDVVCGWRANRKDSFSKKIISKFANGLRRSLIGEKVHDSGCTLKIFKQECFDNLDLYGEAHRYLPAILKIRGFRITEIKVAHHPRKRGKTKYGLSRVLNGFLDLISIYYWTKFGSKPMHFFGSVGILTFVVGFIGSFIMLLGKLFYGIALSNRPLLWLFILLLVVGVQFILTGILAELIMKVYYKTHNTTPYNIKNFNQKK